MNYTANGRTKAAIKKLEYWQSQLDLGRSIDDLAREQAKGKKYPANSELYYTYKLIDYVELGTLRA